MEGIVAAAGEIDERAGDAMVGRIIPRGEIWSGTSKNSGGHMPIELPAEVSAINRVEAHRPRQIEAAEAGDPGGIRIVVVKLHGVRLVEGVLQGWFLELRM